MFEGETEGLARAHPWSTSSADARHRYVDFKASPELIRTALEDFIPFAHYPAVEAFYALLAQLNGACSRLETNDCAFSSPELSGETSRMRKLSCEGRVMLLFRDLPQNMNGHAWPAFVVALHRALHLRDTGFELGMVGTALTPVRFVSEHARETTTPSEEGVQLMVSFWAWGGTDRVCMTNLGRVLSSLAAVLRPLSSNDADAER
jgi:hypothetical protein